MKYKDGFDIVKFRDLKIWHLRGGSALPGGIARALCGDIGRVDILKTVSDLDIFVGVFCEDCISEYFARQQRLIEQNDRKQKEAVA